MAEAKLGTTVKRYTIAEVITMLYDLEDTYDLIVDISYEAYGDPVAIGLMKEQVINLLEKGRIN